MSPEAEKVAIRAFVSIASSADRLVTLLEKVFEAVIKRIEEDEHRRGVH